MTIKYIYQIKWKIIKWEATSFALLISSFHNLFAVLPLFVSPWRTVPVTYPLITDKLYRAIDNLFLFQTLFLSQNTFWTLNESGHVTYQAIVMVSFDFLAAAIPPSTSSVFLFGRQAKHIHWQLTFKLWAGLSLSIDQIWTKGKRRKCGTNDVVSCP